METHYDFLIVGTGYGGSILGMILAKQGLKVLLVDRENHPRFSVGESSTPIADALLAALSDEYQIPELRALASYGTWKSTFPALRCGLKRGFSYFCHDRFTDYHDSCDHKNSSLVAASISDELSDTQWLRSDIDQYLLSLAAEHGATPRCGTTIEAIQRASDRWQVRLIDQHEARSISATWIIDASGHNGFGRRWLHAGCDDHRLRTKARAIFGHFRGVGDMAELYSQKDHATCDWIFNPDDAAQHHVIQDGWLWILRFDCSIASVGLVTQDFQTPLQRKWEETIRENPMLDRLMSHARQVHTTGVSPMDADRMVMFEGPIAKMNQFAYGDGWVALPNAFGFIDPLHSTGIAHNLSGVRRLANIFTSDPNHEGSSRLKAYQSQLQSEVEWIDSLVALCYAGLPNPRLFMDLSSFYFAAVISQESSSLDGYVSDDFLNASNQELRAVVGQLYEKLSALSPEQKHSEYAAIKRELQRAIEPWNTVGLLQEKNKNRIRHSAVAKWQQR